jgi:fumarate hydratase class II
MMQVIIGSVNAFTTKCVAGIRANREKAEGWLGRNAIVVTALNPLIGYSAGAALVKEALQRNLPILDVALEKVSRGELKHRDEPRPVTEQEVRGTLSDLRRLTEGGIVGGAGGGG